MQPSTVVYLCRQRGQINLKFSLLLLFFSWNKQFWNYRQMGQNKIVVIVHVSLSYFTGVGLEFVKIGCVIMIVLIGLMRKINCFVNWEGYMASAVFSLHSFQHYIADHAKKKNCLTHTSCAWCMCVCSDN